MRFALRPGSLVVFFAVFLAGMAAALLAKPLWKLAVMEASMEAYTDLTYRCDQAMRGHLIAKMTVSSAPSQEAVDGLKAAEIELLACQDYDLMQKRLIRWGLTDNEISEMALLAVEAQADTLQEVVRVHEIRY